ncbi:MAG: prepilin peptidase [Candidatus Eremiobacteraeota bacterium]|nr:prepilin peptidase [Candidatus Eremiobacteraeota bacterium]
MLDPVFINYFFTFWAFVYGLMVGSFLNVCIYRLPPKLFIFDDVLLKEESDFTYYLNRILVFLRLKKDEEQVILPSLYAEGMIYVTISPESIANNAFAHNFNLFRAYYPDPVNIVKPRSFCPRCGNMIKWWMNLPILSYIFLGGKCYYCKSHISPRYLINELIVGILWGTLFYIYGVKSLNVFFFYVIIASLSVVIFYIDLDFWIILDEITLPFTLVGIIFSLFIPYKFFVPYPRLLEFINFGAMFPSGLVNWFNHIVQSSPAWIHPDSLLQSILGAIIGFAIFWSIRVLGSIILRREAMGGGDVKLAMLMGAFLGPLKSGCAFFLAVVIGTLILLPLLLINKKTGKDQVPFGCFLAIATIITIYFGDKLIWLYFSWPMMVFK